MLILIQFNYFFFYGLTMGVIAKNALPNPRFSRNFIISELIFRAMNHSELIILHGES